MRVLHIGKYYPPFSGGIESFMADLLPAQSDQGLTVAALVHDHDPQRAGQWPSTTDVIPLYRAPCHGQLLHAPISPRFPQWFQQVLDTFQPDLLHLHMPNTSALWALALPAARRLPWIIHWHADVVATGQSPWLRRAYPFYRPFEQRLIAHSRAIIVTSPPYLAASTALAPWHDRCHVIPLGLAHTSTVIDPAAVARAEGCWEYPVAHAFFDEANTHRRAARSHRSETRTHREKTRSLRPKTRTPRVPRPPAQPVTDPLRVLAIGRLTAYKGHPTLLQAAANMTADQLQVRIVGAGEERIALERHISALGVADRVQLLGFQSDTDRNALLASCDVLCLPSLNRAEAFGVVLLEAMRAGKPVIASDIAGSGVGWVIRTAGHGVLVPPHTADALTTAFHTLHQDPIRRAQLGQQGTSAFANQWDITAVAQAITALYKDVLHA